MKRPMKVATPAAVLTVVLPSSCGVAPLLPVLVVRTRVMAMRLLSNVPPEESTTLTTGWVVKGTPAVAPAGWVVNSSLVGGA